MCTKLTKKQQQSGQNDINNLEIQKFGNTHCKEATLFADTCIEK